MRNTSIRNIDTLILDTFVLKNSLEKLQMSSFSCSQDYLTELRNLIEVGMGQSIDWESCHWSYLDLEEFEDVSFILNNDELCLPLRHLCEKTGQPNAGVLKILLEGLDKEQVNHVKDLVGKMQNTKTSPLKHSYALVQELNSLGFTAAVAAHWARRGGISQQIVLSSSEESLIKSIEVWSRDAIE